MPASVRSGFRADPLRALFMPGRGRAEIYLVPLDIIRRPLTDRKKGARRSLLYKRRRIYRCRSRTRRHTHKSRGYIYKETSKPEASAVSFPVPAFVPAPSSITWAAPPLRHRLIESHPKPRSAGSRFLLEVSSLSLCNGSLMAGLCGPVIKCDLVIQLLILPAGACHGPFPVPAGG